MWLRVMILLAGLCFFPLKSYAVTCTVSAAPNITFSSAVAPFSGLDNTAASLIVNYTCVKGLTGLLTGATICFNIGASSTGATAPRQMSSGTLRLNYQLYQNSGLTTVWGNQDGTSFGPKKVPWDFLNLGNLTGSFTIYAIIPRGQVTAVPGSYQDVFTTSTASITANINPLITDPSCGSTVVGSFAFTVAATVNKQCNISATRPITLSSVPYTQTNTPGDNIFTMACTNGTAYNIGLTPSNNNTIGNGVMKSTTSGTTNNDQVPYQLKSQPGIGGAAWGSASPNIVSDVGTGQSVDKRVYVIVPSANYRPDTYADTVTINVTY